MKTVSTSQQGADLGVNRKRLEQLGKIERVRFIQAKLRNNVAEKALFRTKNNLSHSLDTSIDEICKKRFVLKDELRRLGGNSCNKTDKFEFSNKDKLMLKQRIPPLHTGNIPTTQQLTPKSSRFQPAGANVMVYSKNDIPIRRNKPFQPQKLITHSNDSIGAILLAKRHAKKHEEMKTIELERLKLYEPEIDEKSTGSCASNRISRKSTGLSSRSRTKLASNFQTDFEKDFQPDFQKNRRKNYRPSSNLKYSLQHESIPTPPTIFKRQFTGYGRKLVQIRCNFCRYECTFGQIGFDHFNTCFMK